MFEILGLIGVTSFLILYKHVLMPNCYYVLQARADIDAHYNNLKISQDILDICKQIIMPRKKKHRKQKKNRHMKFGRIPVPVLLSNSKSASEIEEVRLLEVNNMSDTLVASGSVEYSTPMRPLRTRKDSFQLDTPVKKAQLKEDFISSHKIESSDKLENCSNSTSVEATTPVNKRRSLNRQNESRLNGTWNTTNLNTLFDLDADSHRSQISLFKNIDNRTRSNSSIPKLHSPGKEKALSFHKSTQTVNEDELKQMQYIITETPKIIHKRLSDNNLNMQEIDKVVNNVSHIGSKNQKLQEIHINPYLKEKDVVNLEINAQISRWQKERSVDDMFNSPHLFDFKSSSTPIQEQKLLNYFKESDLKENTLEEGVKKLFNNMQRRTPINEIGSYTPRSGRLKDQILNNSLELTIVGGTPHRREDINLNTPPIADKVLNKYKSNSLRQLGSSKKKASLTVNRSSPKSSYSRTSPKKLSFAKLSVSRRSALGNSSERRSPTLRMGMFDRMVNKIKRYSKASAKWSTKMMDSCTQLGIQIKNSLSSFCNVYNERSLLESSQSSGDFDMFKTELVNINKKLNEVNEKIVRLMEVEKNGLKQQESLTKLHEELEQIKRELSSYTNLRSEIDSIKEQIQCMKHSEPVPISRPPPMPLSALPPPPPPPPPPPMPILQRGPPNMILRKSKSTLGTVSNKSEARPVISLDEILKVKLKKPSERPVVTPQRRLTMPVLMQDDHFHHVKLRSKNMCKNFTPKSSSFSSPSRNRTPLGQSISPASNLNRLLDSGSVWPVKRLRRGGYSFDSVHRRALMSPSSRERIGS